MKFPFCLERKDALELELMDSIQSLKNGITLNRKVATTFFLGAQKPPKTDMSIFSTDLWLCNDKFREFSWIILRFLNIHTMIHFIHFLSSVDNLANPLDYYSYEIKINASDRDDHCQKQIHSSIQCVIDDDSSCHCVMVQLVAVRIRMNTVCFL